jgi:tripartite-type tricarboxylate transporter receptor subunit TctC
MTSIKMTHVPYKGSVPAVTDLVAGNVQLGIPTMPAALPFVRSGRLKPIAISTAKRSSALADVPTIAESGVRGYDAMLWTGLLAPAATPPAIVGRLHGELAKVVALEDVKEALAKQGAEPAVSTPEEFSAFVRSELAKWAKVVKAADIRLD